MLRLKACAAPPRTELRILPKDLKLNQTPSPFDLFYFFPFVGLDGIQGSRILCLLAGLIAEQFLETTAAQLTYHGLCELTATAKEDELSVFFRNNHFSTMTKHKVMGLSRRGAGTMSFP